MLDTGANAGHLLDGPKGGACRKGQETENSPPRCLCFCLACWALLEPRGAGTIPILLRKPRIAPLGPWIFFSLIGNFSKAEKKKCVSFPQGEGQILAQNFMLTSGRCARRCARWGLPCFASACGTPPNFQKLGCRVPSPSACGLGTAQNRKSKNLR
jgi:hypothetical protein